MSRADPAKDATPPIAANGWTQPVPLAGPVNTAGVEDSPFLSADGEWLFFFFTPDINAPAEQQLMDGVSGIWLARRSGEIWLEPERLPLANPGEVALNGCPTLTGETLYFCSARVGILRDVDMYQARWSAGEASGWQSLGELLNVEYQVGELHISADGSLMVFASRWAGGLGGYDLWVSAWDGQGWGEPANLGAPVNSAGDENRPYLSPDGQELWFDSSSRQGLPGPAVYRALRQADGSWGLPEEIISQFAGEPNLSADGSTLLFVHHYLDRQSGNFMETDIYVSYRIDP